MSFAHTQVCVFAALFYVYHACAVSCAHVSTFCYFILLARIARVLVFGLGNRNRVWNVAKQSVVEQKPQFYHPIVESKWDKSNKNWHRGFLIGKV